MTELDRPRTIEQAAEELNLSPHTVRAWVAQDRIDVIRLGRAVRVPAQEVARLLREGLAPAVSQGR